MLFCFSEAGTVALWDHSLVKKKKKEEADAQDLKWCLLKE